MFFRRQEGEYRETDRVTRFKLIKSGKHWLRASTSQFGLFKVLRGGVDTAQVTTEVIEEQASTTLTGLDILKGIAAAGTVLGGGLATTTHVYAEETTQALEKEVNTADALATVGSAVLGNKSELGSESVITNSQSDSQEVSLSASVSESIHVSETASKSLKESESAKASLETSLSASKAISESGLGSGNVIASILGNGLASQAPVNGSVASKTSLSTVAEESIASLKEVDETAQTSQASQASQVSTSATENASELSLVIENSLNSLATIDTKLTSLTVGSTALIDTTITAAVATTVTAENDKKAQEDRKRLSKISATMGEYLAKSIGLPNTTEAVAKVNAAVTAIEEALKTPNADLTDVIKQATSAQNSIVNAVLRANNGKRSVLNGRRMERGVSFREVAPENTPGNTNLENATVAYVISEAESQNQPLANGYKPGTYIYATEGRQGNGRQPGSANVATRVEVKNIRNQVYMTSTRNGNTTEWEVTFNNTGERHDNPYFYFTVPKGHTVTRMEVWQKDNANSNSTWNLLGKSEGNNTNDAARAFLSNSKSEFLRAAIGNAKNNGGGPYYENVAGVGPSGVGRGSLTSLRDFAFNNSEAYYQTDKISDKIKKAGDFAFNTIEEATANVFAINPKGSARQEIYKFKYTTTSPTNTDDFYMAGFRSLENSRHRNYLQMNGSPARYSLELKSGVPSTFLKYGKLNDLTSGSVSSIANIYDNLTGEKTDAPVGNVTYSIKGRTDSSAWIRYQANTRAISFSRGHNELTVATPNSGSFTLPFKIVTQADVYEPVIDQGVASNRVSKDQMVDPASFVKKIDDKSNTIPGFQPPQDPDDYNDQVTNQHHNNGFGFHWPNVLPNTKPVSSDVQNKVRNLNIKNVEWVGGSNRIGSGVGENMAVKARVDGKEVYLSVPDNMDISRLGDELTNADKQAILKHHDLDGKAQITGTKIGLSKQLKTIYKDDEGGDSVDVSEVFFENVAKSTATKPQVNPKSDGSVVVSPATDNDKVNISYTPTTSTTANTPTQITIKKSGTTWENTDPLPSGVTLDKSNGNVTISEEAVKDKTDVTATSYNFNSDGATTTATAKAPYQAKSDRFYAVEGENPLNLTLVILL